MPWTPIPILMYHAVEASQRPPQYKHFYVLAKEFAGQMRMLKRLKYAPITFDLLGKGMAGEAILPKKPILLTFDDGYANLLAHVHPLLKELDFPYTVFLVPEKVGGTNDWVAADGYEPTPLLQWTEIRQMQAEGGVDFQAHTLSHPHLNRIPPEQAAREIRECKTILEQQLQKPVTTLCYPYGSCSPEIKDLTQRSGYIHAVTTDFGRVRQQDDPFSLPRISVYHVPPLSLTYGIGTMNFRWRVESRRDTRKQ